MSLQMDKVNPSRFDKSQLKFYVYLVPLAIFMALPIVFIICHAFKPMDELFAFPPKFLFQNQHLIILVIYFLNPMIRGFH